MEKEKLRDYDIIIETKKRKKNLIRSKKNINKSVKSVCLFYNIVLLCCNLINKTYTLSMFVY